MKRKEDSLIDLWDNVKCANISIIGPPKRRERDKEPEETFEEEMAEIFSNMEKTNIPSPGSTEILHSIKPRQKDTKAHSNLNLTKIFQKRKY